MKELTFKSQINIGIVIIALGFVLSTLTKIEWFTNIAWFLYGLLFVLHPVCPPSAQHVSPEKIRKYNYIAGGIVMFIAIMTRFHV